MRGSASFNANFRTIQRDIDDLVVKETEKVANAVWTEAVRISPIWTGAYVNSWLVSYGSPTFVYADSYKRSGGGSRPSSPAVAGQPYQLAYVTNGAPYATLVEFGGPKNTAHLVAERASRVIPWL